MSSHLVRRLEIVLIVCLSGFLCGCDRSVPASGQAKAAEPLVVHVTRPHKGQIARTVTLPGEIKAYQQATLYAKVGGYLKSIAVDKGDDVKEGAVLAEIEVPELLADLAKYKAEVEVAEIDYRRVNDAQTKAPDLVVPQAVDNAKGKLDIARANLTRAETLLGFARITAPFSGVVTRRLVDPGAFIPSATSGSAAQSAALLALMDFDRVRVQVAVPEAEVPFIKNGLPVKVMVEELAGRIYEGTVTRYAAALDEATKTMLSEIEISNPRRELRPGMFAAVKIAVEQKNDALLIPVEAVVVGKAGSSVFTVVGGKARKIAVNTGFNDGISVEVLDKLRPDEPVVLVGKQALSDGQLVNVVEAK